MLLLICSIIRFLRSSELGIVKFLRLMKLH